MPFGHFSWCASRPPGRGRHRKPNRERRSFALPRAVSAHRSAVHFNKVPDDCQSKSQPAVKSGESAVCLSEAVENIGQKIFAYSFAGIRNGDPRARLDAFECDLDSSAPRREFDRVCQQIPDYLLKTIWVTQDCSGRAIERYVKIDV